MNKNICDQTKLIYYTKCRNGSIDIIVNINGHDILNYNYCNLKTAKSDYPDYKFIKVKG